MRIFVLSSFLVAAAGCAGMGDVQAPLVNATASTSRSVAPDCPASFGGEKSETPEIVVDAFGKRPRGELGEVVPHLKSDLEQVLRQMRYPRPALFAGLEGDVQVRFAIDRQGLPFDAQIEELSLRAPRPAEEATLEAARLLQLEALRAVQQLRFEPGRKDNEPVCVIMHYPFHWETR